MQKTPDLAALVAAAMGAAEAPGGRIAVAVSGGPDSLGLLAMAVGAFPGRVLALTVDHGLRAGSAGEAEYVAGLCAAAGVLHKTLLWEGDRPRSNVQAKARDARYALMAACCERHGAAVLLTAHHAEDQAETVLMRLARGAGVSGLSGIRACRALAASVWLVRPLLGVPRARLHEAADTAGWTGLVDPSNASPRHDRTHVRALLARESGLLPADMLAGSAARLAVAEAALDWAAERAFESRAAVRADHVALDLAGLPQELQYRLLVRAFAHFGLQPRGAAAAQLLVKGGGTLAGIRVRAGEVWTLEAAKARRP